MTTSETAAIEGYHAHVYYDAASRELAQELRSKLEARFPAAEYGRWHDKPVGPHPQWSYQVAFGPELFDAIVPFIALNRNGLTVFLHPESGDVIADHIAHAIWMGSMPDLNIDALKNAG